MVNQTKKKENIAKITHIFTSHLRFKQNVLAFQTKRTCVSSKTYLRFILNALTFKFKRTCVFKKDIKTFEYFIK